MTAARTLAFALAASALALGLAACSDDAATTAGPSGDAVANVPPPAGQAWADVVAATPDGGMRMGNPNAPIKLVEYGSLSCPHCARLSLEGFAPLVENYVNSGRVSFEFRSFPIHGVIDVPLTVLVRCADPAAYFGLVEQIYAEQNAIMDRAQQGNAQAEAAQGLPPAQRLPALADAFGLTDWFAARGVSVDQSHACLANVAAAQQVVTEGEAWTTKDGINQTPTLMINGNKLQAASWGPDDRGNPGLEAALKAAGAR